MKKILALVLLLATFVLSLVSCGAPKDDTQLRVGYMTGPTGMGMAKLVHDNSALEAENEKYTFEKFTDTKKAQAALTAGNIDVICVPTNEAASYYNTQDKNTVVLAINTLNTLFVLTDKNTSVSSFEELNGKTVYTCKNGTPKIILQYLLDAAGVNATVSTSVDGKEIATPAQLGEMIVAGKVEIAVAPEPIVTSSIMSIIASGNPFIQYSVDISLDEVWDEVCDFELSMGCVVASRSFVEEHPTVIDTFLDEYEASIEFISNSKNLDTAAAYVVDAGVMQAVPAAKTALSNLGESICFVDGEAMKEALTGLYEALGLALPDDDFYYER